MARLALLLYLLGLPHAFGWRTLDQWRQTGDTGYALVFTHDTTTALTVGYLIALTWWGIRLTAQTLRLAFPTTATALHRLLDRANG
ncbi:hypothetical protein [Micromonospora echinaurantiaca]|uniref:hypothetical protein n=1 Tax=Micromonospora echinaurantiaca TaxID=47857 RepID=UPI0037B31DC3